MFSSYIRQMCVANCFDSAYSNKLHLRPSSATVVMPGVDFAALEDDFPDE